eukprot:gnl/MRDRNA2_/MRDRNA2_81445_c1_seq1.p1 gnl/MRDRNA2_/MRDRNA2_81445_c1~~gnl/MRDRNA2_/MRDRNA2_81445_c1_seq1.p1  ORF type:complete len:262 (-),score=62.01 gnl/MRDRNA2_/MRDRNA2_81445_c1_seq1:566-1351(-)
MSPLPPSTPTSIELGLSNHPDLWVKEVQLQTGDAESSSAQTEDTASMPEVHPCSEGLHAVEQVQHLRDTASNADVVNKVQPEVTRFLSHQEKAQAELDEWRKFRNASQPSRSQSSTEHAESIQDALPCKGNPEPEVQKVMSHQEKMQAELDEWKNFRKAHYHISKVQTNKKDAESTKDVQPQDEEVKSFSQQKHMELDEWREFRKAHEQAPGNTMKALGDLLDMGYQTSENPVAPQMVEGISAWKKKKGRRSYRFRGVSMP